MSEIRFDGRVAIVTGAGGGLGAHYASALAREGGAVVAVDRLGTVEETAAAIRAAGGTGLAVAADLTDPEQVGRMVDMALDRHGRIDILVNNAGGGSSVPVTAGSIEDEDATSWDLHVGANLKTAFL